MDETASTNADLLAEKSPRQHRSVLVADHQTAGRGRLDRRWDAPPGGGLMVSLLCVGAGPPAGDPGAAVRRVSLAALDACCACKPDLDGRLALKWPNDLLLDGMKLAGVLAQATSIVTTAGQPSSDLVVGIGINTAWAPEGAAKLGPDVDRADLLHHLLTAYDRLPVDTAALADRYRSVLSTLGQAVRVMRTDGDLEGRAIDVTDDGRLVVLDAFGVRHLISAGDVIHLRPGSGEAADGR